MKQSICFLIIALVLMGTLLAQTAQNTDPSAILEVNSTTRGFLPPRMNTAQRNAISAPAVGLTIFNLNTHTIDIYTGFEWKRLGNIDTVLSPSGKTWMDRNLGASRVATSINDTNAHGWLYQWGRKSDGHQVQTSTVAAGPVAAGSEGSNFIANAVPPFDWLSTQDDTRWNGATKGAHDPCPKGFRVPTETELENERLLFPSNNAEGAFASVLKFTLSGSRHQRTGTVSIDRYVGFCWSSTVDGIYARSLYFSVTSSGDSGMYSDDRAVGLSVRCIKE